MDNEMIERLVAIQMKHNPQTKVGAAIVVVEMIKAMKEPTDKMLEAGAFISTAQSGVYGPEDVYHAMIDAVINV